MIPATNQHRQHGAALVIGLILLVIITVLAISGMNTATTELAIARNNQYYENAFQAAETGLEEILGQGQYSTVAPTTITKSISENETVSAEIVFENTTIVPDRGFSLGAGSGVSAYHFTATATAESNRTQNQNTDRDAGAVHTQSFYVIGPEGPIL